jgi:hypothetical protein
MSEAPQTSSGEEGRERGFVYVPHYVTDLSLRISEGSNTAEAYFNFGLVTDAFSDCVTIHFPWRGVVGEQGAGPGRVIAVRRNHSIRLGVFHTLTEALAATAHTVTLPDYLPCPDDCAHETALKFFEHCVRLGVACPRYQAEATRREREAVREALTREREASARE